MRSRHADHFNHDTEVHRYDDAVADESNPVRDGYAATLDWVILHAAVGRDDVVADLGTGTGNLAARLGPHARVVCVDVSTGMLDVARRKLSPDTEYVAADLLEFVDRASACDVVMSTYAIHHLIAEERVALLEGLARGLRPGGRIAIGDLMVSNAGVITELRERLSHPDVDELFAAEFPWYVDDARRDLERLGFVAVRAEQTGVLSWGLAATKP
jgi:ubiquinone/menaquinone biosynthesis C-methylase UbiE